MISQTFAREKDRVTYQGTIGHPDCSQVRFAVGRLMLVGARWCEGVLGSSRLPVETNRCTYPTAWTRSMISQTFAMEKDRVTYQGAMGHPDCSQVRFAVGRSILVAASWSEGILGSSRLPVESNRCTYPTAWTRSMISQTFAREKDRVTYHVAMATPIVPRYVSRLGDSCW
jgi:hypothetical protein